MDKLTNQLCESWDIHHRINIYLLDEIPEEHLSDISYSKGRNVGEQFAHMHNVRLMWLKSAAPTLLENLQKIEKENITKKYLKNELDKSATAMRLLFLSGLEKGKIKGFKPNPVAFLTYLISHESHHRGQIILCLKQSGHAVSQKIQFGLWEWGTR